MVSFSQAVPSCSISVAFPEPAQNHNRSFFRLQSPVDYLKKQIYRGFSAQPHELQDLQNGLLKKTPFIEKISISKPKLPEPEDVPEMGMQELTEKAQDGNYAAFVTLWGLYTNRHHYPDETPIDLSPDARWAAIKALRTPQSEMHYQKMLAAWVGNAVDCLDEMECSLPLEERITFFETLVKNGISDEVLREITHRALYSGYLAQRKLTPERLKFLVSLGSKEAIDVLIQRTKSQEDFLKLFGICLENRWWSRCRGITMRLFLTDPTRYKTIGIALTLLAKLS